MQVSVVICCYNSQDRILLTLEHLQSQKTNLSYEIVIVDNNCTDSTIEIAVKYLSTTNLKYSIIQEKKPGLSNARKAGVFASLGEVIIYCDDDNSLSNNYIDTCYKFLVNNQNVGAMVSASIPKSKIELPIWFYNYQTFYACGVFALSSADVTSNGWIWGAGMAMRRKIIIGLYNSGFNNILSGRLSNKLSSGEDIEICKWLILCNYRLYYEENIYIEHVIPESRLKKEYIIKFQSETIDSDNIIFQYDLIIKIQNKKLLKAIIACFIKLDRDKFNTTFLKRNLNIIISGIIFKFGIKRKDFYNNIMESRKNYISNYKNDL